MYANCPRQTQALSQPRAQERWVEWGSHSPRDRKSRDRKSGAPRKTCGRWWKLLPTPQDKEWTRPSPCVSEGCGTLRQHDVDGANKGPRVKEPVKEHRPTTPPLLKEDNRKVPSRVRKTDQVQTYFLIKKRQSKRSKKEGQRVRPSSQQGDSGTAVQFAM